MGTKAKKIVIIEDEKPIARALELKLKKEGYEVAVAHDGKAGLDIITKGTYDVVLLDLMMPVMDGFEVLAVAQKLPAAPVFIVMSNFTQPEDAERCLSLGARKFLVKSETPLASILQEIEAV